ncbi:hypothetical protein C8J56DRAFT_260003 [Mycena floridula]|nr:hypothetical protein C8J56DRAFT_260003 [Mycena floridula]
MATLLNQIYQLLFGPSYKVPPPYVFPPTSQEKLEYAELAIIDLSQASTPKGRVRLSAQLSEAMKSVGFCYVINHGYTQAQTNKIFSIANLIFDAVPEAEKKIYTGQSSSVYQGYKPKNIWRISGDVRDQIEHYNMNRHVKNREHPNAVRPFLADLEDFARHNHFNVLHPILRLLALGLELPEETLVEQHRFEAAGESSARFMKYFPRSAEEEAKTANVWLKGHTDIGSVTILWSQPIGGLQILSPDGQWRWVRHMENALIINAGDALEFICGGYYPPTRHRVIKPPSDQAGKARLGVFYFAMTDDDVKLVPHSESPVLKRAGIRRLCKDEDAPTMEQWRTSRTMSYGQVALSAGKEKGVEEEVIKGVVVKHYN